MIFIKNNGWIDLRRWCSVSDARALFFSFFIFYYNFWFSALISRPFCHRNPKMFVRWTLALIITVCTLDSVSCDFELLLLHTNDMHARFEPTDVDSRPLTVSTNSTKLQYGGFARIKSAVNEAKARAASEGVPSLFLDCGDSFLGSPLYTVYRYKMVADIIKLMDIQAMVSWQQLVPFLPVPDLSKISSTPQGQPLKVPSLHLPANFLFPFLPSL